MPHKGSSALLPPTPVLQVLQATATCRPRPARGRRPLPPFASLGRRLPPAAAPLLAPRPTPTLDREGCASRGPRCRPRRRPWGRRTGPSVRAGLDLEGAEAAVSALAAAAAAVTSAAVSEPLVHATGVPLLSYLLRCSSLQQALLRGGEVMVATAVVALLGEALLRYLDRQTRRQWQQGSQPGLLGPAEDERGRLRLAPLLLGSMIRQAKRLLPICAGAYLATVVFVLLQVAALRKQESLAQLLGARAASGALTLLRHLTQFLQDAAEEVLIVLVAFTALDMKERVVDRATKRMLSDTDVTNDDAVGLVVAGGKAFGVAVWAVASLVTLANYGINLRPLLASLGASSIVLGIAAQSLLRNLAAGITLYTTRPFSVGDQIQLITVEGDSVVEGTVVALQPTRTVIQREEGGSTFYVNNGVGVIYGNPEVTSGGESLKYYASVRVDLRVKERIQGPQGQVGVRVKSTVKKNKVSAPYKQAEFDILFGSGISANGCMLDAAEAVDVVQRRGSWYYFGETRLAQGREKALEAIKEDEGLRSKIEAQTRAVLGGKDINELYEAENLVVDEAFAEGEGVVRTEEVATV